jgi:SAM-dependent methyltransferase
MTLEEIHRHWNEAGRAFPSDSAATPTSRDPYLGELEEENIYAHLGGRRRVLEIGCGDGAHTIGYARGAESYVALDVAESLVAIARKRVADAGLANVEVVEASATSIGERLAGRRFDCVVSQRCLINLPDWETQRAVLDQIADLLEPGGLLLMTEGFQDELDALNEVRAKFGLETINVVPYNHNFRRERFEAYVAERFEIADVRHYGTYLLLTRVQHPLAVAPEPPAHDSPINRAAAMLARVVNFADAERFSYNLFYALRRKDEA